MRRLRRSGPLTHCLALLQTPMAIVILGGLLSATALNMVVLPALYWLYGERAVVREPQWMELAEPEKRLAPAASA
jgi:hypothetical protein